MGAALLCAALLGGLSGAVAAKGAEAPPAPTAPTAPSAGDVPAPPPPGFAQAFGGFVRTPRAPHAPHARRGDDDDAPRVDLDTLLAVAPGMRLVVVNYDGTVACRTWARSAVRMAVQRAAEDRVAIVRAGRELKLESVSPRRGAPQEMDFSLTVPAWLPVALSGVNADVNADGLAGGLRVETVHGDVVARHLAGPIELRSVEGVVDVADARGRIDVSSVNDAVRLSGVAGEISADAVNGDVHLVGVDSRKVEANTVSGDVIYDAPLRDGGTYSFSTHDGDIAVGLPDPPNVTVNVSTFGGDFASAFAIKPERSSNGKQLHFTLGDGGALVNLQSFQGSIELLRRGEGELQRKMDRGRRARAEALKKWGEWNPTRRKEIEIERALQQTERALQRTERAAEHTPDANDGGDR